MTFSRTIDRRAAALAISIGFVAVAFVAQNAAMSRPAPVRSDPLPVLASLPLAQATADVPAAPFVSESRVAVAKNACENQNWPYYSKECLRGEAAAPTPRQVHLQPASITPTSPPAAVTVALANTGARQSSEPRQLSETPRRRKARPTQRSAGRLVVRVRQIQQPEREESAQALAFSW